MELIGQRRLNVDRATAWRALNDPEVLRATIPGCETIEPTAENQYALTIATVLGPVRAKFRGHLKVEDIVAPDSYTLRFEGEGGAAGFAKGSARVKLSADGDGTLLDYSVDSQVGGRIAQVGNRLIEPAARKLAEDFFTAFEAQMPQAAASASVPEARPGTRPAAAPIKRYIVIAAIAAAVIAAIAYFVR